MELIFYCINQADNEAAQAEIDNMLIRFAGQETLPLEIYNAAKCYKKAGNFAKANELHRYNVDHYSGSKNALWSQMELLFYYINKADDGAAQAEIDNMLIHFAEQETLPLEIYNAAKSYKNAGNFAKANELHRHNVNNYTNSKNALWSQMELIFLWLFA